MVFAECPERFARPEILEGDYGENKNYRDNRNYSDNSGYRDLVFFLLLEVLGELDASLSRFSV